jgi:uncharacterized integral membrane protein
MTTDREQRSQMDTETGGPVATRGKAAKARDNSRTLAAAILGGFVAVFAVLNLDEVEVNWIFGTFDTPLIIVIAISLAAGFLLGVFFGRRGGGGRSKVPPKRS